MVAITECLNERRAAVKNVTAEVAHAVAFAHCSDDYIIILFHSFYCCWSYDKTDGARLFMLYSEYVVPWLKCQHSAFGVVLTFQPRDNISECRTHKRAPSVEWKGSEDYAASY